MGPIGGAIGGRGITGPIGIGLAIGGANGVIGRATGPIIGRRRPPPKARIEGAA